LAEELEHSASVRRVLRPDAISVPTSFGDFIDKITILEIKSDRVREENTVKTSLPNSA